MQWDGVKNFYGAYDKKCCKSIDFERWQNVSSKNQWREWRMVYYARGDANNESDLDVFCIFKARFIGWDGW